MQADSPDRRRAAVRPQAGKILAGEVSQYPLDDRRVFDGGDDLDRAPTFGTGLHIYLKTRLRRFAHRIAERCSAGVRSSVWVDFMGIAPRPRRAGVIRARWGLLGANTPWKIVGVDVSKDRLDLYDWDSKCPDSIANDIDAIDRWLDGFSLPVRFAIEPTNQFHIALAERAHARGHAVYLVDPHRLSHYRCGVGQRAKADPQDAQLLARYLAREGDDLAPWKPLSQGQQRFWRLLRRRATVVAHVSSCSSP